MRGAGSVTCRSCSLCSSGEDFFGFFGAGSFLAASGVFEGAAGGASWLRVSRSLVAEIAFINAAGSSSMSHLEDWSVAGDARFGGGGGLVTGGALLAGCAGCCTPRRGLVIGLLLAVEPSRTAFPITET